MKHTKLIITVFVTAGFLSSCYKTEYGCHQLTNTNGTTNMTDSRTFPTEKKWENFRAANDTIRVNDSTLVYWDCYIAK